MALTQAFGKIKGLASSYWSHPTMMRAKAIASSVARNPNVRIGALAGAGAGAAVGLPSWVGDYKQNRNMGRSGANSYARATIAGYPKILAGAATGALGYGTYKAMGGYGGMRSAAYGAGAKAARWGSGLFGKMAGKITG